MMYKVLCMLKWITILWLFELQTVAASYCSGNQITWINKNNTSIRCSPCPPCPPGQEFTIPCNTRVSEGTTARCRDCPKGKYSSSFDTKPCVYCKTCSKRHVKRTCTSYRNAKCGDCLTGYYKAVVVSDCIECDKCCYDGKDNAPPGCKKVGKCKPRLHGCPPTPSSIPVSKPTTKRLTGWGARLLDKKRVTSTPKPTTKAKVQPLTKQDVLSRASTNKIEVPMKQTSPRPTPSSPHESMKSGEDVESDKQTLVTLKSYVIIISVVCFILVIAVIYLIFYLRKEKKRPGFNRSTSVYSTRVEYQPTPSANDITLREFMENGHDVFEEVCTHLNSNRKGRYDFDRIGNRLELTRTQLQELLNNMHQNRTKELFETICCSTPTFTVKQLAKVVKDIKRNDVYEMLEPFFEKPVE